MSWDQDDEFRGRSILDLEALRGDLERCLGQVGIVEITPEAVARMRERLERVRTEICALGEVGT